MLIVQRDYAVFSLAVDYARVQRSTDKDEMRVSMLTLQARLLGISWSEVEAKLDLANHFLDTRAPAKVRLVARCTQGPRRKRRM